MEHIFFWYGVISLGGSNDDGDNPHGDWTAPYRSPEGASRPSPGSTAKRFSLLLGRSHLRRSWATLAAPTVFHFAESLRGRPEVVIADQIHVVDRTGQRAISAGVPVELDLGAELAGRDLRSPARPMARPKT